MLNTNYLSDQELVQLTYKGDEQACNVLFCRYRGLLFKVAGKYTKEKALAEDLVQEACIRIYTAIKAGGYTENGKFPYWAQRVANNICVDYLRKEVPVVYLENIDTAESLHGKSPSPEEQMIRRQTHARLQALVNGLPAHLKQVVYYRYYEEMMFKNISEKMNTNINTTLGRMRYSLQHLRKNIKTAL